jgi:hypothetical protein
MAVLVSDFADQWQSELLKIEGAKPAMPLIVAVARATRGG